MTKTAEVQAVVSKRMAHHLKFWTKEAQQMGYPQDWAAVNAAHSWDRSDTCKCLLSLAKLLEVKPFPGEPEASGDYRLGQEKFSGYWTVSYRPEQTADGVSLLLYRGPEHSARTIYAACQAGLEKEVQQELWRQRT